MRQPSAPPSQAAIRRTTPNDKGDLGGSAAGANNGGGRPPRGHHVMVKGLLRCGLCGSSMTPHSDRSRRGGAYEVCKCRGRASFGPDYCAQGPVDRATLGEAILSELSKRYLDIEETRARLWAKRQADAALADEALAQAERQLAQAEDAHQGPGRLQDRADHGRRVARPPRGPRARARRRRRAGPWTRVRGRGRRGRG